MKHSSRVMSFVTALTMPTVMGPFSHSVSPFDCRRNPDQVTSESLSSARREEFTGHLFDCVLIVRDNTRRANGPKGF
jgi:hypothetical protein